MRQAAPVDGPVDADQGDGVQVADDAVGLDRLVAHDLAFSPRSTLIEPHDGRIVNALRRRKDTPDIHLFCATSLNLARGPSPVKFLKFRTH